jgi:hypothetical protein
MITINKKIKTIITCSILTLMLTSCYKDNGNYSYISDNQLMSVEISALDSVTIKAHSQLNITPQLTNDDENRYSYMWYTINDSYPYKKDTLSTQRDLSVNCNLEVGSYILYFQVKDSLKDIYKHVTTHLNITATDINAGWYVMKETNGTTDVDYFSLDKSKTQTDLLADVVKTSPLQGKPVSMIYIPKNYYNEKTNSDGSTTLQSSQSAYQIASNKDMITLNSNDMSIFKKLKDEFYELPSTINIQSLSQDYYYFQFLINDGHTHTLSPGGGIGKFSYQLPGGYNFHPDILNAWYSDILFDQTSMKFYMSTFGSEPKMMTVRKTNYSNFFADSLMTLVRLLPRVEHTYSPKAYLVLKSGLTGKYYTSQLGAFSNYYSPTPSFQQIPSISKLLSASVMAAPTSASVIYFSDNNKLMMFKVATGEDVLLKTFDTGEKITFIKNFTKKAKDETAFDDLIVVTTTNNTYKVYRFPLVGSAGEIDATSAAAMIGTGEASFVMFRNN